MIIYTPAKAAERIPVIDLSPYLSGDTEAKKTVAWEVHKASRETGFFYIRNHGVPFERMEQHLELARMFFDLPAKEKNRVHINKSTCNRGYEPIAAQTLDEGSPPDLKEGFLIGNDLDENHPYVKQEVPNTGSNQWPEQPEGFKDSFNEYVDMMRDLGRTLAKVLALSLDLTEAYFDEGLTEPVMVGRLLHYPSQDSEIVANQLGAGAHTDWGMLTMLLQDDIGGLEVQNSEGDWISAPPKESTFVVNLGEMMRVFTNGIYRSNMHRVVNNHSGKSRYSCPTFFDPDYFYKVKCVPTCIPESGKLDFPETTAREHVAYMYEKTYGKSA
ncbi:MAG: isopenicillin N synthase family oxygenase [Gammaproteobacteria bacterium]|nr:isopenicillin N synthase family oxygenase [Gammaproteobacteria bacterium]